MSFDHTLLKGTTSKIVEVMLRDSTTGQGKTGISHSDVTASYVREGSTRTAITLAAGSAGDAYSSGKFAEVDATNCPGLYQLHLPNASLTSGVDAVTVALKASGILDRTIRLCLLDVDLRDSANAGLSDVSTIKTVADKLDDTLVIDGSVYQFTTNALENAPSGSGGGGDDAATIYSYFTASTRPDAFKADVSGLSTFNESTDTVTVGTNNDKTGYTVSVVTDKTGYTISGTKQTLDDLNDIAATDIVSDGAINTSSGAVSNVTTVATTTTNTDMRGTDSAFLASSAPSNIGSLSITVDGKVTVGTNDDKTGYSINGSLNTLDDLNNISTSEVASQVADELAAINLDHLLKNAALDSDITNNSVLAKMVSSSATASWTSFDNTTDSLQAIRDRGDSSWGAGAVPSAAEIADAVLDEALSSHTTEGSLGAGVSTLLDDGVAIQSDLSTLSSELATVDSNVDQILVDTGTTLPATLQDIDTAIAVVDGNVDAVLTDTGTTIPATLSTLSTLDASGVRSAVGMSSANLDTQLGAIDTNVAAVLVDTGTTIPSQITALNDLDAAGIRTAVGLASANLDTQLSTIDNNVDAILVDTGTSIPNSIADLDDAESIADAVWDESIAQHNVGGSTGKALKQLKEGTITVESQVNDAAATTTTFITDLTESTDGFYHDKVLVFTSGDLSGQARHVETYNGTTKSITVSKAFTSAPADDAEFLILAGHEHALSEIADSVWDESRAGHTDAGTFGYYLDARVSQVNGGGGASAADIWGALLSSYNTPGTFGARFQTGQRFVNTTANIRYVTKGNSYDGVANPVLEWEVTKDYTSYTATIEVTHRVTNEVLLSKSVTVVDETTLQLSLSSTDTAFSELTTDADFGPHPYAITATSGSSVDTAVSGAMVIRKQ